jgi:hypothetical protein
MTFINNTKISIRTQLKISQLQKVYNNSWQHQKFLV